VIFVLLQNLGWSEFFESQRAAAPPGTAGRVASANHGRFTVWVAFNSGQTGTGQLDPAQSDEPAEIDASVGGLLRRPGALWPAVGDWVLLRPDEPVIDLVLNRKTCLSRKQPEREVREQVLAANIDVLFIVSGLDRDYNPRRIERFLVMAHESGARPVILLNKADLAPELGLDLEEVVAEVRRLAPGATILPISALSDEHLDDLPHQLGSGETAAMIGSSGVGKSTILNRLLGDERQRTTAVRASDSRGRHTTTTRQLFRMPGGWLLMDLPGLREVQLWANASQAGGNAAAANLDASFDDIYLLAQECRFRDCTHTAEPGCAVVSAGIDTARLANFQKMQKELAHLERKADPKLAKETRAKWKAIEKSVRSHPKREH
jgi:ribosome biogenesis GTPase